MSMASSGSGADAVVVLPRLVAQVNLVSCALTPTSLYMVLHNGGPPTLVWLDAPD